MSTNEKILIATYSAISNVRNVISAINQDNQRHYCRICTSFLIPILFDLVVQAEMEGKYFDPESYLKAFLEQRKCAKV